MNTFKQLILLVAAFAVSACNQQAAEPVAINNANAPDMVLLGGKVLTVDTTNSTAEAIAVTGNRISAVGRTEEIRALAGANTSIVELDGRTVIPGLTDSHIHVIRSGLTWAQEISWADIPTLDEALAKVREAATNTPEGEWLIVAGGWHKYQFVEKRLPTAIEISEVAGNHPIYVQYLYDTAILNQAAMTALNIATDADVPPNGHLRLSDSGTPTGEIDGTIGVFHRLQGALPKPDFATQVEGTKQFMTELNRLGMTSFSDGSGGSQYPEGYKPLFHIWQNGEMTMRVAYRLMSQNRGQELIDLKNLTQLLPQGFGDDWLRFNGFGEVIIWGMHDGSRARPEFNPADEARVALVETLSWMAENRYAMEIHASSDSSAQQILDIFEDINITTPIADLRWSILHIDAASESTLTRMKDLGVAYGVQDRLYFDGESLVETFGAEHARSAPPIQTALNMGLMIVGGTDAPAVGPYNPWVSIRWMLDGKTVNGQSIRSPEEIPSREDALRTYTQNGAWLQFSEHQRGSIEIGKMADIAVLSGDYMSMPVEELNQISSVLTVVDGKVVYADAPYSNLTNQ